MANLWEYNNKNFKIAIRMYDAKPHQARYIGVFQLAKYIGEKRAAYIRGKMENLSVNKKKFEVQNKGAVYVYLR